MNEHKFTYRLLLRSLLRLSEEQLDCDVTVNADDEFFPAKLLINSCDDVLDQGHPYLQALEDINKEEN
jgi:hypothetical protein